MVTSLSTKTHHLTKVMSKVAESVEDLSTRRKSAASRVTFVTRKFIALVHRLAQVRFARSLITAEGHSWDPNTEHLNIENIQNSIFFRFEFKWSINHYFIIEYFLCSSVFVI